MATIYTKSGNTIRNAEIIAEMPDYIVIQDRRGEFTLARKFIVRIKR